MRSPFLWLWPCSGTSGSPIDKDTASFEKEEMVTRSSSRVTKHDCYSLKGQLKGWPLAGTWELGFGGVVGGEVPIIPRTKKSGLLCLYCTNNVVHAEHLPSFWESGILLCVRQRLPT